MPEVSTTTVSFPSTASRDVLTEVLRQGTQAMLTAAIEAEVAEWIDEYAHLRDKRSHRQVVRNGHLPNVRPQDLIAYNGGSAFDFYNIQYRSVSFRQDVRQHWKVPIGIRLIPPEMATMCQCLMQCFILNTI